MLGPGLGLCSNRSPGLLDTALRTGLQPSPREDDRVSDRAVLRTSSSVGRDVVNVGIVVALGWGAGVAGSAIFAFAVALVTLALGGDLLNGESSLVTLLFDGDLPLGDSSLVTLALDGDLLTGESSLGTLVFDKDFDTVESSLVTLVFDDDLLTTVSSLTTLVFDGDLLTGESSLITLVLDVDLVTTAPILLREPDRLGETVTLATSSSLLGDSALLGTQALLLLPSSSRGGVQQLSLLLDGWLLEAERPGTLGRPASSSLAVSALPTPRIRLLELDFLISMVEPLGESALLKSLVLDVERAGAAALTSSSLDRALRDSDFLSGGPGGAAASSDLVGEVFLSGSASFVLEAEREVDSSGLAGSSPGLEGVLGKTLSSPTLGSLLLDEDLEVPIRDSGVAAGSECTLSSEARSGAFKTDSTLVLVSSLRTEDFEEDLIKYDFSLSGGSFASLLRTEERDGDLTSAASLSTEGCASSLFRMDVREKVFFGGEISLWKFGFSSF